jgi:hypothetical protein
MHVLGSVVTGSVLISYRSILLDDNENFMNRSVCREVKKAVIAMVWYVTILAYYSSREVKNEESVFCVLLLSSGGGK